MFKISQFFCYLENVTSLIYVNIAYISFVCILEVLYCLKRFCYQQSKKITNSKLEDNFYSLLIKTEFQKVETLLSAKIFNPCTPSKRMRGNFYIEFGSNFFIVKCSSCISQ